MTVNEAVEKTRAYLATEKGRSKWYERRRKGITSDILNYFPTIQEATGISDGDMLTEIAFKLKH